MEIFSDDLAVSFSRRGLGLLLSLALACTAAPATAAAQNTDSVNFVIHVTDWATGEPVGDATVVVAETGGSAATNAHGFAHFRGPSPEVGYWTPVGGSLRDLDVTFEVYAPGGGPPQTFLRATNHQLGAPSNECCEWAPGLAFSLTLNEPLAAQRGSEQAGAFSWELEQVDKLPCVLQPDGDGGPIALSLASTNYPTCGGAPASEGTVRTTVETGVKLDVGVTAETGRLLTNIGLSLEFDAEVGAKYSREVAIEAQVGTNHIPDVRGEVHIRPKFSRLTFHKLRWVSGGGLEPTGETKVEYVVSGYCTDVSGLSPCLRLRK